MITRIAEGVYELLTTLSSGKVLYLDDVPYQWAEGVRVGTLQATRRVLRVSDTRLRKGVYRLFRVNDEGLFTTCYHLEIATGSFHWQGYLLPTGLPTAHVPKKLIISTNELLADSYSRLNHSRWMDIFQRVAIPRNSGTGG